MSPSSLGILLVSFGTSVTKTRQQTLDAIEAKIRHAFPSYCVYHAWMSETLRKIVFEQEQLSIPDIPEALRQMKHDGIQHVILQPTFITNGLENSNLITTALRHSKEFTSFQFGSPLLGSDSDIEPVSKILFAESDSILKQDSRELLIFMGHGTASDTDHFYTRTDEALQKISHKMAALKRMNSNSAVSEIAALAKEMQVTSIVLAPFMITAGRHALRDMDGDSETSWKSQLKARGFSVRCVLRGLGEYERIQNLFVEHIIVSMK